jgi:hypothetical protein
VRQRQVVIRWAMEKAGDVAFAADVILGSWAKVGAFPFHREVGLTVAKRATGVVMPRSSFEPPAVVDAGELAKGVIDERVRRVQVDGSGDGVVPKVGLLDAEGVVARAAKRKAEKEEKRDGEEEEGQGTGGDEGGEGSGEG